MKKLILIIVVLFMSVNAQAESHTIKSIDKDIMVSVNSEYINNQKFFNTTIYFKKNGDYILLDKDQVHRLSKFIKKTIKIKSMIDFKRPKKFFYLRFGLKKIGYRSGKFLAYVDCSYHYFKYNDLDLILDECIKKIAALKKDIHDAEETFGTFPEKKK